MRSMVLFLLVCGLSSAATAHNSYTGGYSGAPGMRSCAISCHGGASGTLAVTGFPTAYQPGQTYRITVKHNSGSPIVNFNATTRIGATSSVAGTFTAITNSTLYSGADGGVYASPHSIDSAVFQWTAPASGTGPVTLYAAAFQGTTSSSNGQSSALSFGSTELVTDVREQLSLPRGFALFDNYPNPFNPTTTITYQLEVAGPVTLTIVNILGREFATLANNDEASGLHSIRWNASNLPSGIYFCRLRAGGREVIKKLVLMR